MKIKIFNYWLRENAIKFCKKMHISISNIKKAPYGRYSVFY